MVQLHGNGAIFSDDDTYRYLLWRTWDESLPRLLWVLLNPSTADAEIADPTLSACIGFSQELRYGGLEIVNLFAFRATNTKDLKKALNPVGPENDRYIIEAAQRAVNLAAQIVVGWGEHGSHLGRDREVCKLLKHLAPQQLYYVDQNQNGSPRHPLYVARNTPLKSFSCDTSGLRSE